MHVGFLTSRYGRILILTFDSGFGSSGVSGITMIRYFWSSRDFFDMLLLGLLIHD